MHTYPLSDFSENDQKAIIACKMAALDYFRIREGKTRRERPMLMTADVSKTAKITHMGEGFDEEIILFPLED